MRDKFLTTGTHDPLRVQMQNVLTEKRMLKMTARNGRFPCNIEELELCSFKFNKLKYMHLNSKDKCLQTLLDCWDMISEGEIFCYLK